MSPAYRLAQEQMRAAMKVGFALHNERKRICDDLEQLLYEAKGKEARDVIVRIAQIVMLHGR